MKINWNKVNKTQYLAYSKGSTKVSLVSRFPLFLHPPPSLLTSSHLLPFLSPFFSLPPLLFSVLLSYFLLLFLFFFILLLLLLHYFLLSHHRGDLKKYIAHLSQSKILKLVCNYTAMINPLYSLYTCLAQGTMETHSYIKVRKRMCW